MSWIGRRLFRSAPALDPQHAAALERYRNLAPVGADADVRDLRFVVVDVETSGLDARRDRLLAIGAVAVRATLIRLDDSYHTLLRQKLTSSHENILVHGIDGTSQVSAPAPTHGLIGFLELAGTAPLVAFHSDFDRTVIVAGPRAARACPADRTWACPHARRLDRRARHRNLQATRRRGGRTRDRPVVPDGPGALDRPWCGPAFGPCRNRG